ncbi:putative quinol monooxygenase [Halomonas citrativorans]|uniref:Antibiotic biosynthesis monooxygenase n=1 Tax=Halomonas citrativorans TaxID=2742612 RepID=A0ABR9FDL6_9GAMM|nr:antibiotic biosynthesis monooxygenase [Halomonas citrativorans]MBE0404578.1 antibiotic biosynthesis monooxygenase [Halomonas citrativorans]
MAKVTLKGFIEVPGSDLDGVQAELNTHRQLTLEEPGCITFKVTQDKTDPCRFDVYEEFIDRKAFEEHQQRVASSDWGKLTRNVKRHYEVFE